MNVKSLVKTIDQLIKRNNIRKNLQKLSIRNFYLTHDYVTQAIDNYRSEKISYLKKINTSKTNKNLRILHITNFNERLDGRLFFNTGKGLIMAL